MLAILLLNFIFHFSLYSLLLLPLLWFLPLINLLLKSFPQFALKGFFLFHLLICRYFLIYFFLKSFPQLTLKGFFLLQLLLRRFILLNLLLKSFSQLALKGLFLPLLLLNLPSFFLSLFLLLLILNLNFFNLLFKSLLDVFLESFLFPLLFIDDSLGFFLDFSFEPVGKVTKDYFSLLFGSLLRLGEYSGQFISIVLR